MPTNRQVAKRIVADTGLPYKTFLDITSDEPNIVSGQNCMTSARQLLERRPGFSDAIQTASPTTLAGVVREYKWSKWGGARFFSMVNTVTGGQSKVYKLEVGVDANYILIFTSASAVAFDFEVSRDLLFMGNGTDMRYWSGTGTTTYQWGITRPAAAPAVATTGTGISLYSGRYYRYTYWNATVSHESSASELSVCTGIISNKTVQVGVVASTDPQTTHIRVYATTDGGSTAPENMLEITGSPFANTTGNVNDTTSDAALSIRNAPTTTSNDPAPAASKLAFYAGRIGVAANSTMYFSAFEENTNGVGEMSFPSGVAGNSRPVDKEITSLRGVQDGWLIFTRSSIWKYMGDRRDNFMLAKVMDKRGATNHAATVALGSTAGWLDTASQVWLDGEEIGFDLRTDIAAIDQTKAFVAIHISGKQHWLLLLDGATAKIYAYDLDTKRWMTPWLLQGATSAAALNSGETASGTINLAVAYNGATMLHMNSSVYQDNGASYTAVARLNLLEIAPKENPDTPSILDDVSVETDANINSAVKVLLDDDPATGTYTDITANVIDPVSRGQGANLKKKLYKFAPEGISGISVAQRVSAELTWAAVNSNFLCYTIELGRHTDSL